MRKIDPRYDRAFWKVATIATIVLVLIVWASVKWLQ